MALQSAPRDAPNVVIVLLDDVGFAAASTFGGPIETPTLQRLADEGLRYNRFHTTAICSPTRAALLTGRNPHAVGVGAVLNTPSAYPGYNGMLPKSAATLAEILRQNGYGTAAFGKWHLAPEWESSPAVPTTAGRCGRGSIISTGSCLPRSTSSRRRSCRTKPSLRRPSGRDTT
jgi:arylsulfatase